jgi:hypothetical protein
MSRPDHDPVRGVIDIRPSGVGTVEVTAVGASGEPTVVEVRRLPRAAGRHT